MTRPGVQVLSVWVMALAVAGLLGAQTAAAPAAGARPARASAVPHAGGRPGCQAARFHPLAAPARDYDATAGSGTTIRVPLPSRDVPSTACAVVATLTGAAASTGTYVTAWTDGEPRPGTSNLNVQHGRDSADLITVPVAGAAIDLFNAVGTIRLIVDVAGYYSDDTTGAGEEFTPLSPVRVLDTAHLIGPTPAADGTGATVTLTAAQLRVPASAQAVAVNLTEAAGGLATYVAAYPAGTAPTTSVLNVAARETRAALAVVPLGSGGLSLHNAVGGPAAVRLIADVQGWYSTTATGTVFTSSTPARTSYLLAANATVDDTVGAPAVDAVFTLTVKPTNAAAEQAYPAPADSAVPSVSNVNVIAGVDTPNLVMAPLSSAGVLRLRNQTNAGASVIDLVDLVGNFTALPPGNDVNEHQCSGSGTSTTFPADASFGIVTPVNGLAFTEASPCLAAEDMWAHGTGQEAFSLPLVDHGASSSNYRSPPYADAPELCAGGQTQAAYDADAGCAYDYGWDQAESVYGFAAAGTTHAASSPWWLDIELNDVPATATEPAQPDTNWHDGTSAMSAAQNLRVIEGAQAYLRGEGVPVGLYSSVRYWQAIVGATGGLAGLPEWYTDGQRSTAAIVGDCTTPFAAGPVLEVQSIGPNAPGQVNTTLDYDFRC